MALTRRALLELAVAGPLAAAAGCTCRTSYRTPLELTGLGAPQAFPPILAPSGPAVASVTPGVIDVHAHFFNASDVPVRGFLEECLGHRTGTTAQKLIRAMSGIADRMADLAPTAADELSAIQPLIDRVTALGVDKTIEEARLRAAEQTAIAMQGSEFERLYRSYKLSGGSQVAPASVRELSPRAIADIVSAREQPAGGAVTTASTQSPDADAADGMLGFLLYMLSPRWLNLRAYMGAYTGRPGAFGVNHVLGSLVDFDYWIDCPPRSSHEDQVKLHAALRQLSGNYLLPVVAYNPWTDIHFEGAGIRRVEAARANGFVAAKIYPPMGFRPHGNATFPDKTSKNRPDLATLDRRLAAFFDACAAGGIPVISHTARSNGRDDAHDSFGGPPGWAALLARYANRRERPVIDFGHFGGGGGQNWTCEFATLMTQYPEVRLYADLGYWEELACADQPDATCITARRRLQQAVTMRITQTETVADRTMFATDWLMLSQTRGWPDYPARLRESLLQILPAEAVSKVFGSNARSCFGV